jgi:NAD(P)-dependent dehydrogenase (short-subunit alcohol dehydrogenase family)
LNGELEGRVALVTGGSRGIGEAIVRRFIESGADVVFTARREKGIDEARARLADAGPGRVEGQVAHSGDERAVAAAFDLAESRFGPVDVAVNNAATNPSMAPLAELELEVFDKILATNLRGYLIVAREAARRMRSALKNGVIINVSSVAARRHLEGLGAYGVSKAAVDRMTAVLSAELGPAIRVVGVAPGLVKTRFSEALWSDPALEARFSQQVPAARLGVPDDIAELVTFLASPRAAYISGTTVSADGGYGAR